MTCATPSEQARQTTRNRRRFVAVALATIGLVGLSMLAVPAESVFDDARSVTIPATQFSSGAVILLFTISGVFLQRWRAGTEGGSIALGAVTAMLAIGSLDLVGSAGGWLEPGIEGFVDSCAAAARVTAVVVLGLYIALWRDIEPTWRRLLAICVASFGTTIAVSLAVAGLGRTPGGVALGGIEYTSGLVLAWLLIVLGSLAVRFGHTNHRIGQLWMGVLAIVVATSDLVLHHASAPTHVDFLGGMALLLIGSALVSAGFQNDLVRLQATQTDRMRSAELQAESGRQALEAERNDRALVAHDGRSALLAIEGGLRYIATNPTADPAATTEIHRALTQELARLRRMLSDRELGESKPFLLADAIAPAIRLHALDHQSLVVDAPPTTRAHGDPDATREIVKNLLDNAIHHGNGAEISIRVTEWVDSVTITVADRGPGVPHALHEAIFERGVSSKPDDAAGLGLHSSRELASRMGGSLRIDPVARGASFILTLPVEAPSVETAPAVREHDAARVIDLRRVEAQ